MIVMSKALWVPRLEVLLLAQARAALVALQLWRAEVPVLVQATEHSLGVLQKLQESLKH